MAPLAALALCGGAVGRHPVVALSRLVLLWQAFAVGNGEGIARTVVRIAASVRMVRLLAVVGSLKQRVSALER